MLGSSTLKLLNQEVKVDSDFDTHVFQFNEQHNLHCDDCDGNNMPLNEHILSDEISKIIDFMHCGKATGNDGLLIEMLKACTSYVIPYLLQLYNQVLDIGNYPLNWSEAIIYPLHKRGVVNKIENFRGITLLPILSKIFTKDSYVYVYNENVIITGQKSFKCVKWLCIQMWWFTLFRCF